MAAEDRVILELLQTHASLVSSNHVLLLGQKVIVTGIETGGYYPYKIGDGVTAYNSLSFAHLNRNDAAADFTSDDPVLLAGQHGYETDTGYVKIGDGTTAWTSLLYSIGGTNTVGQLHLIPEADRSAFKILSAGVATTFTDVDFGAYTPTGVKAVVLKWDVLWTGDGSVDYSLWQLRKNGSSETGEQRLGLVGSYYGNASAMHRITYGQIIVPCDTDGIIEYRFLSGVTAKGSLSLNIEGYYI